VAQLDFTTALGIAQAGFDKWKTKAHNARWFRRIDGTPISNDLCVNIAEAFVAASVALPAIPPETAIPTSEASS
jgi:hypothetical protein